MHAAQKSTLLWRSGLRRAGVLYNIRSHIWLVCGPKRHMFQLYEGCKIDVTGSSASGAATCNWSPATTSVVVGSDHVHLSILLDGFVELPSQLVQTLGSSADSPLVIEPS